MNTKHTMPYTQLLSFSRNNWGNLNINRIKEKQKWIGNILRMKYYNNSTLWATNQRWISLFVSVFFSYSFKFERWTHDLLLFHSRQQTERRARFVIVDSFFCYLLFFFSFCSALAIVPHIIYIVSVYLFMFAVSIILLQLTWWIKKNGNGDESNSNSNSKNQSDRNKVNFTPI